MPLALRQRIIGAGLSRFVQAKGHTVVEVNHPNRQLRHQNGKSDPLDAESAARAVLGGRECTAQISRQLGRDDPALEGGARHCREEPKTSYGHAQDHHHQRASSLAPNA
jgi:hypothetical protein